MKIVLAFDSFKECISAAEACHTAALAIKDIHADAEITELPLSDGGEGLTQCISKIIPTYPVSVKAHGPLMEEINAEYIISSDGTTAYMEMAATSGLALVPIHKRNPLVTTTYGVGEMIIDATRRGCSEIVLGIGGSATCDGGKGMLEALKKEKDVLDKLPHITVACDVTNPLYGHNGAAYIFAPQKGATPEQVKTLDNALRKFAQDTEEQGIATAELANYPGAGAAGGLGYGLIAYLHAELMSGIDIILNIIDFDNKIIGADLIITGEGKSDEQTLMGKVPHGVLKRAWKQSIPVWLLSGAIDDQNGTLQNNFDKVKTINQGDNRPLNILMQPQVACCNLSNTVKKLVSEKKIVCKSPQNMVLAR